MARRSGAKASRTKSSHSRLVIVSSMAMASRLQKPSNTLPARDSQTLPKSSSPRSRAPSEARLARSKRSLGKPSAATRAASCRSSSKTFSGCSLSPSMISVPVPELK